MRMLVEMPPQRAQNTLKEALRQMDQLRAEQMKDAAQ
ncbi:Uncharacterised protein [Brevundimonas diminuta]|nr:Uncharacterised protein [Brevundimonas diminuta]